MNPMEGSLLLLSAAVALVGLGYGLGRTWPRRQPKPPLLRPRAQDSRPSQPSQPAHASTRPPRVARRPDLSQRLQQEMEHVKALRRARENAEPWRPPSVDAVEVTEAPAQAVWFADTAVEPRSAGKAP